MIVSCILWQYNQLFSHKNYWLKNDNIFYPLICWITPLLKQNNHYWFNELKFTCDYPVFGHIWTLGSSHPCLQLTYQLSTFLKRPFQKSQKTVTEKVSITRNYLFRKINENINKVIYKTWYTKYPVHGYNIGNTGCLQ